MKNSINTNKTLEAPEKHVWPPLNEVDQESYLITECNRLRKIPLKNFTTEDFRILIGQDIGLKFLIPLAIEILKKEILAVGDCYLGDLLANLLRSDKNYWKENQKEWNEVCNLYQTKKEKIKSSEEIDWEIKKDLKEYFSNFQSLN